MNLRSFLAEVCSLPDPKVLLYDNLASKVTAISASEPLVFVGCGSWDGPTASQEPLFLQYKGSKSRFGLDRDHTSITEMLAACGPELLQEWTARPADPLGPSKASPLFTIVVEDAGPDAVFSYLLFLALVAGLDTERFFPDWQAAVDEWERHGNCGEPTTSWCALESALTHRRFPFRSDVTEEEMGKAWGDALRFAGVCLHEYLSPEALPQKPICAPHGFALAALEQERQAYEQWLQHSDIVQISLPIIGAQDRRLIVDALFVDEDQMTGSAKIFYRNDRQNSPLKKGFALAVHYRAGSSESNPDITIDLDPRRGVHLLDLHKALEGAENEAWEKSGKKRSVDNARYMENVPNKFEQPWYMDREHSLIGSPRRLLSGKYGSKLSREAVFNVIWNTCEPLQGIKVRPYGGSKSVAISDLQEIFPKGKEKRKHSFLASWLQGEDQIFRSLPDAPTVWRMLACLTTGETTSGREAKGNNKEKITRLSALPLSGEYDRVQLHGGIALVTENGAFVLDDWSWHQLDLGQMKAVFDAAQQLDEALKARGADVTAITEELEGYLRKSASIAEVNSMVTKSARLSTKVSALRGRNAVPPYEANARAFRLALDNRWAIDKRLDDLEKQLLNQQAALRNLLDSGTASLTRLIAIVGFGGGLAATLAGPVAKFCYFRRPWEVHPDPPPDWFLALFFTITAVACLIIFLFTRIKRLITRPTAKPDAAHDPIDPVSASNDLPHAS